MTQQWMTRCQGYGHHINTAADFGFIRHLEETTDKTSPPPPFVAYYLFYLPIATRNIVTQTHKHHKYYYLLNPIIK